MVNWTQQSCKLLFFRRVPVICDFGSRLFSLVHTVSDARVPCMCPRGPWRALVRVDGFTDDRGSQRATARLARWWHSCVGCQASSHRYPMTAPYGPRSSLFRGKDDRPVPAMMVCSVCSDPGGAARIQRKYEIRKTPNGAGECRDRGNTHFRLRIWPAGRRLMSMSAATRRTPSMTAAAISSLWVCLLRSLHRRMATMTSSVQ